MPCYHPIQAWQSVLKKSNNKSIVHFKKHIGLSSMKFTPIKVSCGRCIGCRLERSRQWAMRCVHEASLHSRNCFITLTYSPEHLPKDGSLKLRHWQLFIKKLRKKYGAGIRFFHCGEYGEKNFRPHYHACIFNFDFPDKQIWKTVNGQDYYISKELDDLWGYGFSTIGDVTFESAAYVARYITKKINGDKAAQHYAGKKPEYITMSRRPGIASGWFDKYHTDVYPSDQVVLRGNKKLTPPKFYDRLLEKLDINLLEKLKLKRVNNMELSKARELLDKPLEKFDEEFLDERLSVKEICKKAQFQQLKRNYENGDD